MQKFIFQFAIFILFVGCASKSTLPESTTYSGDYNGLDRGVTIFVTPVMEIATAQKVTGEQAAMIAQELEPFAIQAAEWAEKAAAINVTSIDQTDDIAKAKQSRIAIKKIRMAASKRKGEMKEGALNYGRGLDAVFKHIESLTKPIEAKLQESEDFVKAHYAKVHADMVRSRSRTIEDLGGSPSHYNLSTLTDDEFDGIVGGLKLQVQAELDRLNAEQKKRDEEVAAALKEATRKAEEAKAKAEADQKERERIAAENARLKADREKQIARETAEREERERIAARDRKQREARPVFVKCLSPCAKPVLLPKKC